MRTNKFIPTLKIGEAEIMYEFGNLTINDKNTEGVPIYCEDIHKLRLWIDELDNAIELEKLEQ